MMQSELALTSRDKLQLWYHGMVTRKQAEQRLSGEPSGSFLVRISETHYGYSLSYKLAFICYVALTFSVNLLAVKVYNYNKIN